MSDRTGVADQLAVDGGAPVRSGPWPTWPLVSDQEWDEVVGPALKDVYLSGVEGLPGRHAKAFAADFAHSIGAAHGVMTPHGTDAIMAALAGALDLDVIGDGGEVIIPNYTFVATASAALAVKCRICFVDVEPRYFTTDPAAVESAVGPDTVGILTVHLGGQPSAMDALNEVAGRHQLAVVEDCAQAHGARYGDRGVGSLGDAGAYSFQSSKNLTSGEGGCVTTNQYEVYERVCSFVDVGRRPGGERWEYPRLGWNYRPSEYLGALLHCRLPLLEAQAQRRADNAAYLAELLADVAGITPPALAPGTTRHGYHLYMMLFEPEAFGGHSRAEFARALGAEGIPCNQGYTSPLSEQAGFIALRERYPDAFRVGPCPNVEYAAARSIWLTQSLLLAERTDMEQIAEAIVKIGRAWG